MTDMKTTKDRIVAEGLRLVAVQGLNGVTLGVLAQQTSMSKSGLFAHFGSKEEVQLSVLDETNRLAWSTVIAPAMKKPEGLSRLRAVVQGWFNWSERAGIGGGCPLAAGMFERDDFPEANPIRKRLTEIHKDWRHFLVNLVDEAVQTGELKGEIDASQFVWELLGIYLAHHASHRFSKDPSATKRANAAFTRLIGPWIVTPGSKKSPRRK